jgi:hypothetical protein
MEDRRVGGFQLAVGDVKIHQNEKQGSLTKEFI